MTSHLEAAFAHWWALLAADLPAPEREYRFAPPRRWRFDFAWPDALAACECDGGAYSRGRHTRGAGFEADAEKLNEATVRGWRVLRFTGGMLDNNPAACIEQVRALLTKENAS